MRIVMIGSGKVGAYLARELTEAGHSVVMIEKRHDRAMELAENAKVLVVHGDGTDVNLLRELNLRGTDLILALTGVDEDNFVACHLARTSFGVQNTLARLNDPRNRHTFEALAIPVVSVADLLVRSISRELDLTDTIRLDPVARGSAELVEAVVPDEALSRTAGEVNTVHGRVLMIVRGDDVIIPGDSTTFQPGDHVLMVCHTEHEDEMLGRLSGEDNPPAVPSPHALVIEDRA